MAGVPRKAEVAAVQAEWALAAIHTRPHTWACPSHPSLLQLHPTAFSRPWLAACGFPELQNNLYSPRGKRYPPGLPACFPHPSGTEPGSTEREVWESGVRGRNPAGEPAPGAMELQVCRPAEKRTEAAAQLEILVAGDKENSGGNSSGSCVSCPGAPAMALPRKDLPALLETELLPWTDTTPEPCSPGCLA